MQLTIVRRTKTGRLTVVGTATIADKETIFVGKRRLPTWGGTIDLADAGYGYAGYSNPEDVLDAMRRFLKTKNLEIAT